MTLGDRIKRERERLGWSQNELARRARVRQAQLSEVEAGKRHDMMASILRRIARALGVSMDYLAGIYEDEKSEGLPAVVA
jgi:transcriptional regulator with XRE-family HTH domain